MDRKRLLEALKRIRKIAYRSSLNGAKDTMLECIKIAEDAIGQETPRTRFTKTGKLRCTHCKRAREFCLVEEGYYMRHDFRRWEDGKMIARGGLSSDLSEVGSEQFVVDCGHCFTSHRLPEEVEIEWI